MVTKLLLRPALLGLIVVATGCSSAAAPPVAPQGSLPEARPAIGNPVSKYIKHVVVIIQENRSFENFFAGYRGANARKYGCAAGSGARRHPRPFRRISGFNTASGCPSGDTEVPLHSIGFDGPDLAHDWNASMTDWDNGKMDGFYKYGENHGPDEAYAYVRRALIKPYWDMAEEYVLADEMFPTEFGGSFTGHLTLVAGTDDLTVNQAEVDFPSEPPDDCDSPPGTKSSYLDPSRHVHRFVGPFPCFDQWRTMAQDLDSARVSWKYYATSVLDGGMWEPYEASKYVRYGPDWRKDIIAPQKKVLTDASNGSLASVTWVSPTKADSDHPAAHSDLGPSWVASVVNAVGESSYWPSTAIIVLWDDWGGWYDNASPKQLDYRGLGIRVPCLIISPYAKETSAGQPGYVSHTQYEFGSILKFIEEAYNLKPLGQTKTGYSDQRATSIEDSFDFTQTPRKFTAIPSKYPISHFLHEPPSNEPVDTE
jgi:phospholipase C